MDFIIFVVVFFSIDILWTLGIQNISMRELQILEIK